MIASQGAWIMGWSNLSLRREEMKVPKKAEWGGKKLLRNMDKWEPWEESSAIVKAWNSLWANVEDQKLYEQKGCDLSGEFGKRPSD